MHSNPDGEEQRIMDKMMVTDPILLGLGDDHVFLHPKFANRHGLIAGATGTGKTVSLQVLAEGFSRLGVPVFMADVKGDLSGISQPGKTHAKIAARVEKIGISDFAFDDTPVAFWDLYGKKGHPIRATISDMGPLLLSRLLDLNETQEGVLTIAFEYADDEGLLLLDLDDLRAILQFVGENAKQFRNTYGNVSSASIGAIMRRVLVLERAGGDQFFGEPMLNLEDLMITDRNGRGIVNVLAADKLMMNPMLYSTFLLWLLSELFENLPEVGDPKQPVFVFFFDEAHLLFKDTPKALLSRIEQVVRLIRSKGVGIYFITQSPLDIPETVLGQLGNKIQHALRAFTPREKRAVSAVASTFRQNPEFDCEQAITDLAIGEALVSVLEGKGTPSVVEKTLMCPPRSRLGPAKATERKAIMAQSPLAGIYNQAVNRDSAYEILSRRAEQAAEEAAQLKRQSAKRVPKRKRAGRQRQSVGEAFAKSIVRTIGNQIGRRLVRGLLGSLFKGR